MTDTNQLPEPELGYIKTDKSNQPAFSARQMREAMRHALQARAQVQGEPMAWLHWLNGPVRVFMNKDEAMMELDRLNREYPSDTDDRKMRPLILGDTAPQATPVCGAQNAESDPQAPLSLTAAPQQATPDDMKVYASIADRYFREATQAEVTDGIRPEDFTVDVVVKSMGGFAPVNTQGVRVTHKPTGISVTCDAARSQHTNRHQALETLRAILALRPEQPGLTGCNCRWDGDTQAQWCELHLAHKDAIHEWAERAKEAEKQLALRPERVPMTDEQISFEAHNADDRDWNDLRFRSSWHEGFLEGARFAEAHHGITARAKKEGA